MEDKSLGCTQKSGSAPVMDVLAYGQPVRTQGLNLLSAPGNDLVASTALAASGATNRTIYNRTRNSVCITGSDCQNIQQFQSLSEKEQLDRFQLWCTR